MTEDSPSPRSLIHRSPISGSWYPGERELLTRTVKELLQAQQPARVDRELVALDRAYPGYGFAGHKGYPTRAHLEALRRLGVTPVHRRSFAPVRALLSPED